MDLLTQDFIDSERARLKLLEAIYQNHNDEDGNSFISLNVNKAGIDRLSEYQKLLDNGGVAPYPFMKDPDGNVWEYCVGNKWKKPYLMLFTENGVKYINGRKEEDLEDMLTRRGYTRVIVNVPAWYALKGSNTGNAWIECYVSPINHVTGAQNPYYHHPRM